MAQTCNHTTVTEQVLYNTDAIPALSLIYSIGMPETCMEWLSWFDSSIFWLNYQAFQSLTLLFKFLIAGKIEKEVFFTKCLDFFFYM